MSEISPATITSHLANVIRETPPTFSVNNNRSGGFVVASTTDISSSIDSLSAALNSTTQDSVTLVVTLNTANGPEFYSLISQDDKGNIYRAQIGLGPDAELGTEDDVFYDLGINDELYSGNAVIRSEQEGGEEAWQSIQTYLLEVLSSLDEQNTGFTAPQYIEGGERFYQENRPSREYTLEQFIPN